MKLENKKIAVIWGGPSTEAEISAQTADAVYNSLQNLGLKPHKIEFSSTIYSDLERNKTDLVYNAMHGCYGEDGCLQGMCEIMRIPYSHSGVKSSAIAMSKPLTKEILKNYNIQMPSSIILTGKELKSYELRTSQEIKTPFVIKPVEEGSSIGVQIINSEKNIDKSAIEDSDYYMIEDMIHGRELTVAVLDGKALGVLEIKPKSGLYDYSSKYTKGASEYIVPAEINENIYKKCLEYAEIAHKTLGCRGITRSDMIYDEKSGEVYFLEINTHPGMTENSLVPKIAKYQNIGFDNLVLAIIKTAMLEKS